jgi:D-galactarolactone isomerase
MIEPLSNRVAALGWHVQIYMPADRIVAAEDLWNRFPTPLVFDHLRHLPQPDGVNHPAFSVIRRLIDKDRAWVKISGAYIDTKIGPPTYADSTRVAQAYVKAAPERASWAAIGPIPTSAPSNLGRIQREVGYCRSEVEQVMPFSAAWLLPRDRRANPGSCGTAPAFI